VGGDISNPQSLNRYTYVLNQPTTLIDPTGLDPKQDAYRKCLQQGGSQMSCGELAFGGGFAYWASLPQGPAAGIILYQYRG
jgi:uncharacterized protein RhaS with RHS repeats